MSIILRLVVSVFFCVALAQNARAEDLFYDPGLEAFESLPMAELQTKADKGDLKAQFVLATRYHYGKGVPKDNAKARHWYGKSAHGGYNLAQFTLGLIYADGEGVPKDNAEAYAWFRLAFDDNEVAAQSMIETLQKLTPEERKKAKKENIFDFITLSNALRHRFIKESLQRDALSAIYKVLAVMRSEFTTSEYYTGAEVVRHESINPFDRSLLTVGTHSNDTGIYVEMASVPRKACEYLFQEFADTNDGIVAMAVSGRDFGTTLAAPRKLTARNRGVCNPKGSSVMRFYTN